jgi:hypothetical protein
MPITVHVVLLEQSAGNSASGGRNQEDIGLQLTGGTGGRFERIAVANRLVTLLPEIGQQVAALHRLSSQRYRITVRRPAGKSGSLGRISAAAARGMVVKSLSRSGRLRN